MEGRLQLVNPLQRGGEGAPQIKRTAEIEFGFGVASGSSGRGILLYRDGPYGFNLGMEPQDGVDPPAAPSPYEGADMDVEELSRCTLIHVLEALESF